ncbi:hypothetical protein ACET3Z_028185 [Daucus carota]
MAGSIFNDNGDARTHMEVDQFDGVPVVNSSTGGIPVMAGCDADEVSSGDRTVSPTTARELCNSHLSTTIQAVLRNSKQERDALFAARKKLMEVTSFLRKKGFSEENIYEDLHQDGYFTKPLQRDEFGLPKITKDSVSGAPKNDVPVPPQVIENMPLRKDDALPGTSGVKNDLGQEKEDLVFKSSTDDRNSSPTSNESDVKKAEPKPSVPLAPDVAPDVTPVKNSKASNTDESTPLRNSSIPTDQLSDNSPTPLITFRNLKRVDEVDKKLLSSSTPAEDDRPFTISKAQRKKLKKAKGKSPPPPSQ